ncbi:hypothetical protein PRIPAC_90742 [Pristionchus pacificus]|uniref:Uncharacterized protein n=1 Tax=Pristionchus pacificus TaxID=54126 RepID=A0A454Y221_PRIPA|nr:hypothetical protein PRIPAC_90742 [Pristionchus pacificus]|eukprot:PDM61469.1 hypothetical protein PRIPAC_50911 [Pristionchus pacificus]
MRSLPVLLIALVLLPLSTAIKCKYNVSFTGLTDYEKRMVDAMDAKPEQTCDPGISHCVAFNGAYKDMTAKAVECARPGECKKHGCSGVARQVNDGSELGGYYYYGRTCCCKGDMCTPPADGGKSPAALLSLAALAAVLAARF